MRFIFFITHQSLLFSLSLLLFAAESKPATKPGIKTLQLASDHKSIQPGKAFSVGLYIQHLPEYHTYWKAPGIVGVPTTITWELPEGFTASEIEWPVPELTKMAQYTAYGYERDVSLLTEISAPEEIKSESVTLKARVAFMCCAKTCHPGWHDFELTIPVTRKKPDIDQKWKKIFDQTRDGVAPMAPASWAIDLVETDHEIQLKLTSSKQFPTNGFVYCFCDSNLIHSDRPQTFKWSDDKTSLTILMQKSEFGPENLKNFTASLFHPDGWPEASSKWVRISTPMPSS